MTHFTYQRNNVTKTGIIESHAISSRAFVSNYPFDLKMCNRVDYGEIYI